jgi:hypothetical protein
MAMPALGAQPAQLMTRTMSAATKPTHLWDGLQTLALACFLKERLVHRNMIMIALDLWCVQENLATTPAIFAAMEQSSSLKELITAQASQMDLFVTPMQCVKVVTAWVLTT